MLKKQIRNQVKRGLSGIDIKTLVRIFEKFSWKTFAEDFNGIVANYQKNGLNSLGVLSWLRGLLLENPSSKESHIFIRKWFQSVWESALSTENMIDAKNNLNIIFQILSLLGDKQLADKVLQSIQNYQNPLTMPFTYAPAILEVIESCKQGSHDPDILKNIAEDFLKHARTSYANPPKPPENWARTGKLKCTCPFCDEVNKFIPDPQRSSISFEKTLKGNIIHIEEKVEEQGLDLDVCIERQPPRFKGLITKNQKAYEKALKQFAIVEESKQKVESWMKKCFS